MKQSPIIVNIDRSVTPSRQAVRKFLASSASRSIVRDLFPVSRVPWLEIRNAEHDDEPVEILIYDQIGRDWFDDSGVEAQAFAEALAGIDRDRDIVVGINSPGGNVWDGLAIYHQLQMRRDRVTTRVDGVAASIASIIALAGSEVVMPANSMMMIHDPSGLVMGTSADMRQMADALDKHADVLASIYAAKAGGTRDEWRERMRSESWYSGADAADLGLADTVTDEVQLAAAASLDFSRFRRVPEAISTPTPSGAANAGATRTRPMNRSEILALLRRHGIRVANNATNQQLLTLLGQLPRSAAAQRAQAEAALAGNRRGATPAGTPRGIAPQDPNADPDADPDPNADPAADPDADPDPNADPAAAGDADPQSQPAATPAARQARGRGARAAAPAGDPRITQLEARLREERERRIGADLDSLIEARPYLMPERDAWLERAMTDEAILDSLRAMPEQRTGADPIRGRIQNLGNPLLERYGAMQPGAERNQFRLQNFAALRNARTEFHRSAGPQAANTLAAALVTDWLADGLLVVVNNRLAPLAAFSRDFSVDPMKPRATVQVRKAVSGSTTLTNATNFEQGDSQVDAVAVTVNQVTQPFHVTNNELQSGHRLQHLAQINSQAFVNAISDVWTALLLDANYGTPTEIGTAANFAADDLPPIWAEAKDFPFRNLLLDGGHLAFLLPTDREKFAFGESGAYGFDLLQMQNRWTDARLNTVGFVASPNAVALASGLPLEVDRGEFLSVETVTAEQIGLTVVIYTWWSRATRTTWASYDVMFGAAAGEVNQGQILTTANT